MDAPMSIGVAEKAKGFLLKPSATFQATRAESLSSAFQYYVILLIIFSALMFIVYAAAFAAFPAVISGLLPAGFGAELSLYLVFFLFVLRLYGIFLSGLAYHVFVILFGGTQGVVQTIKTVMYASTPDVLLGWIPIISIVGAVWTLILIIIGIRENQEMPLGRAVLVLVVPLILSLISAGLLALTLGAFYRARLRALTGL
jgi:hypothetical protein